MQEKNLKEKALLNFKKSKTLLEKIIAMTEKDEYCMDIMQQNLAVVGLLRSAHGMLMDNHLQHCFHNAVLAHDAKRQQEMIDEIAKVSKLYNR
jgi:DNA-binding FrmR family transcriptional regulator